MVDWIEDDNGQLSADNMLHGKGYNARVYSRGAFWGWSVETFIAGELVQILSKSLMSHRDNAQSSAETVIENVA